MTEETIQSTDDDWREIETWLLPVTVSLDALIGTDGFNPESYAGRNEGFCYVILLSEPDGSIYGGSILVHAKGFSFRECVIEEMAQLMGLPNDSNIVAKSKFRTNPKDKTSWLTWHDAIMLRTLYDFRLKPGMPRAEALPIVRVIIGELLAELNRPN